MSNYVELMSERKKALFEGDEKKAAKFLKEAEALAESGKVTEDELIAGAYL